MKKLEYIISALIILLMLMISYSMSAQEVRRQGNNFTQVSNQKASGKETKTQFTYTDSKGNSL